MKRILLTFAAALVFFAQSVCAAEESNVDLIYPLALRRPIIENELDLTVRHARNLSGRETDLGAELEYHPLSWWQIALGVPVPILNPGRGTTRGGLGDITLENKFLLYRNLERRIQAAGGLEVTIPSGSKSRGLGGETAIEPFLVGGAVFGSLHLMADGAYEWVLNSPDRGERKQEMRTGLALGYALTEKFLPLLEFTTVRLVRGVNQDQGPKLRHKQQFYLTPGFNLKIYEETTLRFGVQLPLTQTREFEYKLHLGLAIEF